MNDERARGRRMKIALVSPYDLSYPGGVTEHIYHLADHLGRLGNEVHILAPSSGRSVKVPDGVRLHSIGRVVSIPTNGSVARITLSLRVGKQVREVLQAERFDIVHLHEPLAPLLPLVVLLHSDSANVGTFHAVRRSNLLYRCGHPLLLRFFHRLHGLIAVSTVARDFVAQHFPGEYRIIPNGVDYERFGAGRSDRPQGGKGGPTVLFVGRLEGRKGVKYLLEAWTYVRTECPAARLTIVGDGRPLDYYRTEVLKRGWHEVTLTGYIPSESLSAYYRSADIFCAPSTGGESFGIVLLEAMAAGLPIVATRIPGYQHLVTHGKEGLLVQPKNAATLGAALVYLLQRPELRRRMGDAGRETAKRYAWDRVASQVLDLYLETQERWRGLSSDRSDARHWVLWAAGRVGRLLGVEG